MRNISDIVKLGLCNGCGTCFSICPNNAIDIDVDDKEGTLFARISEEKCINCGLCLKVCPSLDITIRTNSLKGDSLGNYYKLYYGYSLDDKIRYRASSGGIVSSLFKYLLEEKLVDAVVFVKPSYKSPFIYEPHISSDVKELLKFAGTRYFPVPMNKVLKKILSANERFAVIGTPCQIYAISKFENFCKELRKKIFIKVGFFCGGVPNINSHRYLLYAYNIDAKGLISVYRGVGWPGYNVLEYKDGRKILISRRPENFVAKAYHTLCFFPIFAQKKCLLCVDKFASYADVSVGDAWLDEFKRDKKGTSLIVIRNKAVDKMLQTMRKKRCIFFNEISKDKVMDSQKIFDHFYKNFYTTYLLFRETHNVLKIKLHIKNKKINFRFLILMLLIKFGMKLSEKKHLWKMLVLYGIIFNITQRFLW
ncbi:MAG: Coenzyme F420 hydrogenase/dehydrogenase, beta subunit C-terminal domain [Candidatus Aenigmatarchaeota archaeon]